jgi:hypothetical protein
MFSFIGVALLYISAKIVNPSAPLRLRSYLFTAETQSGKEKVPKKEK